MIKIWYYTFPIYNNLTIVCWHAINRLPHLPCSGGLRLDELDFDGVGYVFLAHCLVRSIQGLLQSCIWLGALFLGPDRHEPFLGEEEKNGTHQPARPHDKHARHVFDPELHGGLAFYEVTLPLVFPPPVRERKPKIWFVGVFVKSLKSFYKYLAIKLDTSAIYDFKSINRILCWI